MRIRAHIVSSAPAILVTAERKRYVAQHFHKQCVACLVKWVVGAMTVKYIDEQIEKCLNLAQLFDHIHIGEFRVHCHKRPLADSSRKFRTNDLQRGFLALKQILKTCAISAADVVILFTCPLDDLSYLVPLRWIVYNIDHVDTCAVAMFFVILDNVFFIHEIQFIMTTLCFGYIKHRL